MVYKIVLSSVAEKDFWESLDYYISISNSLGRKFQSEFDTIIPYLENHPHIFPIRYNQYRVAPIRKFKTLLIYEIDELNQRVVILQIIREERDPKSYIP